MLLRANSGWFESDTYHNMRTGIGFDMISMIALVFLLAFSAFVLPHNRRVQARLEFCFLSHRNSAVGGRFIHNYFPKTLFMRRNSPESGSKGRRAFLWWSPPLAWATSYWYRNKILHSEPKSILTFGQSHDTTNSRTSLPIRMMWYRQRLDPTNRVGGTVEYRKWWQTLVMWFHIIQVWVFYYTSC